MTDQNNLDTTFSKRRARLEDLKDPELQRLLQNVLQQNRSTEEEATELFMEQLELNPDLKKRIVDRLLERTARQLIEEVAHEHEQKKDESR